MTHREHVAQMIKNDKEFEDLWFANRTLDAALRLFLEKEGLSQEEQMLASSRFWWDFPKWLYEKRWTHIGEQCQLGQKRESDG